MKKVQVLAVIGSLALLLATRGMAQSTNVEPEQAQVSQQQPSQDGARTTNEAKTFTGKIVETDGKLVLQDAASKTTYQLDDQEKAKGFVDQQVKVTGTLDSDSGTIRVSSIERSA